MRSRTVVDRDEKHRMLVTKQLVDRRRTRGMMGVTRNRRVAAEATRAVTRNRVLNE